MQRGLRRAGSRSHRVRQFHGTVLAVEREEAVWNLVAFPGLACVPGPWDPSRSGPESLRNTSEISPELAADGELAASLLLTDEDPVPAYNQERLDGSLTAPSPPPA